jgi:hypothetical protein
MRGSLWGERPATGPSCLRRLTSCTFPMDRLPLMNEVCACGADMRREGRCSLRRLRLPHACRDPPGRRLERALYVSISSGKPGICPPAPSDPRLTADTIVRPCGLGWWVGSSFGILSNFPSGILLRTPAGRIHSVVVGAVLCTAGAIRSARRMGQGFARPWGGRLVQGCSSLVTTGLFRAC